MKRRDYGVTEVGGGTAADRIYSMVVVIGRRFHHTLRKNMKKIFIPT
jgi:hypothetical protein